MKKLTNLLSEVFEDIQKVDKHQVVEGVKNYGIVGKQLYNNNNIMEIAKQLAQVAESAHNHILGESDDWFDKISINKNMKSLKGNVMEFQKTAQEAHQLNQRLTGLYEDIGHVLNRYYEISEGDAGDMDNDGIDEPDDEEYLDNKRDAITTAVKSETINDPDGLAPELPEYPAKNGEETKNEGLKNSKGPSKDGNNSPDQYAASDGEEMKESSPGHRTVGDNDPDSGPGGDANGEEIKEAMRQTRENYKKRPVKRLKDISNVGIPALGDLLKKR